LPPRINPLKAALKTRLQHVEEVILSYLRPVA
jgi:hypothetical protein